MPLQVDKIAQGLLKEVQAINESEVKMALIPYF
jgi:hypothetical protein